jgi:hypothetical protein
VRPFPRPTPASRRALLGTAAAALLTGCGGGGDVAAQPTVTQTVTLPGQTESTAPAEEGGDVEGRSFDVGTVTDAREREDGTTVLALDRWTVVGVDDAVLARQGVEVLPHDGSRFTNQNSERTYAVPVAPDAVVVFNECVPPATAGAQPGLRSEPGTLEDFLAMPGRDEQVVLVAYTDGELVRLDTDARC